MADRTRDSELAAALLPLLGDPPTTNLARTQRQATAEALAAVLQALADLHHRGGGVAPSLREIADEAGLSAPSTVRHHMRRLIELRLVQPSTTPGSPRSLRLTGQGRALTTKREAA